MDRIEIIEVQKSDNTVAQIVKIDRGNDEFTWVPKDFYDEMIANQAAQIEGAN